MTTKNLHNSIRTFILLLGCIVIVGGYQKAPPIPVIAAGDSSDTYFVREHSIDISGPDTLHDSANPIIVSTIDDISMIGFLLNPSEYYTSTVPGTTIELTHRLSNGGTDPVAYVDAFVPSGWSSSLYIRDDQGALSPSPYYLPLGESVDVVVWVTSPMTITPGLYGVTVRAGGYNMIGELESVYAYDYVTILNLDKKLYLPMTVRDYRVFMNGSFAERFNGWRVVEAGLPVSWVSVANERTGGYITGDDYGLVALGNPDYPCNAVPVGYAAVEQKFVPPIGGTTLTFNYIVWSQDASINENFDRFEVYIGTGTELPDTPAYYDGYQDNPVTSCDDWHRIPDSGWKTGTIDLTPYQGQLVTVAFRNYSRYDNQYNTYTYLDNVRIQ